MSWYKVDDRLPTSRKLLRIPRAKRASAIGVWTLAGAWSMHDQTDGFIPAYVIDDWGGTEDDADQLVRAGMWEHAEHEDDAGYRFVNWSEYQPLKADLEAKRERDRERKRNQPRDKGGKFAGRTVNAVDSARKIVESERNISDSTVPLPSPPLPTPPDTSPSGKGAKRNTRLPDDWTPSDAHRQQAAERGIDVNLEADKMRDWAISKGESRKDWDATFRNWLRNARPQQMPRGARSTTSQRLDSAMALQQKLLAQEGHGQWTDQRLIES